jgi:hypothetical protein
MPLPSWELATSDVAGCTSCGSRNQVRLFPAALRAAASVETDVALEGEAACFDHPGKRAVAACRHCGRFVCALCSVEFRGEVWCPSCVVGRAGGAQLANLETSRTLYDSIALIAPLVSVIVWPASIVAGPGTVVFSILKWKEPLSLVRRNRWRFVLAIVIGLAVTGGWIAGIGYLLLRGSAAGR